MINDSVGMFQLYQKVLAKQVKIQFNGTISPCIRVEFYGCLHTNINGMLCLVIICLNSEAIVSVKYSE